MIITFNLKKAFNLLMKLAFKLIGHWMGYQNRLEKLVHNWTHLDVVSTEFDFGANKIGT
jgi:hypothetical protein